MLDRDDLGGVIGEGLLEGREEMFRRDFGEWRGLERRLPGLQQRVGLGLRSGRHFRGFRHHNFPFLVTNEWSDLYHAMGLFWAFYA